MQVVREYNIKSQKSLCSTGYGKSFPESISTIQGNQFGCTHGFHLVYNSYVLKYFAFTSTFTFFPGERKNFDNEKDGV